MIRRAMIGKPIIRLLANLRFSAVSGCQLTSLNGLIMRLVELKAVDVFFLLCIVLPRLIFAVKDAVLEDEDVHICGAKATIGVLWGGDDGFTANVEAGVDNDAAAGLAF